MDLKDKLALMKYTKVELKRILKKDIYLELDLISDDMHIPKQKLNERKIRMINRARMHEWVKYLLIFVSSLLLISLIAIVVTIIYTSLASGTMSESGILSAIVTFFSEIVRMLLSS